MKTVLDLIKNKKSRIWLIVTGILLVLVAYFLFAPQPSNAQAGTEGTVVSVDVTEIVETSGSLSAQPFASLEWKTSGVVEEVNVEPGDFVKAGQILLTLQPSSASANIVSAQADLVQAQQELEDLLNSDTARAQAAIDLKDAKDAYEKAKNYRTELNGLIWIKDYQYEYFRGNQVRVEKSYRGYADPETIADADRDLALKMSELEDAQREYDRLKDGPSEADLAAAQAKVDAAQATVNQLSIVAPFSGQVLSVDHRVGDTVDTAELSVNLADMDHLYVEAAVDESDIAKIQLGNPVAVTLDAVSGITLTGQVVTINPVGEVVSGLVKYKVHVELDKTDGDVFLPLGTTANLTIQVKEPTATLAVPITTVQNDAGGEYVLVVQSDGSTKRVDIASGSITGDLVAVTGDLNEGDTLTTSESGNMPPGGLFSGGN